MWHPPLSDHVLGHKHIKGKAQGATAVESEPSLLATAEAGQRLHQRLRSKPPTWQNEDSLPSSAHPILTKRRKLLQGNCENYHLAQG